MMFSFNLEWLALKYENPWFILKCLLPSLTEKDTRSCNRKPKLVRDKRVCKDKYNAIYFQLSKTSKKIHCCALLWPQYHQTTRRFVVQGHLSSVRVTNTCVMGVVPAASRGSPCRVERKVSEPSKPKPDRKAPITGITDSSRSNQWTKACRYCSLNTLKNRRSRRYSAQGQHWYYHEEISWLILSWLPIFRSRKQLAQGDTTKSSISKPALFRKPSADYSLRALVTWAISCCSCSPWVWDDMVKA